MVTVLVASRTVPPLAMSAYDLVLALPCSASTARMAAVSVVLPWSMCPIVPTLTCGLVLVKVSLAIAQRLSASLLLSDSTPFGIPVVHRRELAQPPHRPTRSLLDGHPNGPGPEPLGPTLLTPEG